MNIQNKILVVDDDPVNREFFQLMLSKLGFIVEEAADGFDALEKLKKFQPDLILLDNIMPRMSGFELTKTIKEDPKYREIPLIMFSALDDVQDKLNGFELGIDDYIIKPFNFSEVLARIKATLRNRQLFNQVVVRESRLNIAEDLYRDMKRKLPAFIMDIDELDSAVAQIPLDGEACERETLSALVKTIREKTHKIRKQIAALDIRIEKITFEWEALKKDEIGLSTLESEIRKFLQQDQ